MGLLFVRAAAAAVMAPLRPMLARPLSRSAANVPVAGGVYCAGATAILTVLAGIRGTGPEEAPLPPSAMQTGAGQASDQDCVVKQRGKWAMGRSETGMIKFIFTSLPCAQDTGGESPCIDTKDVLKLLIVG